MRCPDCDPVDQRRFLKTAAFGTASAAVAAALPKNLGGSSETLVTTLYTSLSPEQKTKIVFPFDHPLRSKVDNNWHIVPQKIGTFFTADQQAIIEEIFRRSAAWDSVEQKSTARRRPITSSLSYPAVLRTSLPACSGFFAS